MATIWERGPYQFCARVRRKRDGKTVSETKTFETRREAEEWAAILEGKVIGDEYQDCRKARDTSLSQAMDWYMDHVAPVDQKTGKRKLNTPDSKNQLSKLRYWKASEFADWSLVSIKPWDLIRWRRRVLDEDGAEGDEQAGPEAECTAQTVIHRLNTLSRVYQLWALAHHVELATPVGPNVRPGAPSGRTRRLNPHPDEHGNDEEARLLAACAKSSRPWLRPAVVIALETCMRQGELAGLTWDRVRLDVRPSARLDRTKNEQPRLVPLSVRAVAAFRELLPADGVIGPRPVLPVKTPRAIAHAFRDAISAADKEAQRDAFPDLRWHDLRHEAISRLFELTDLRDHEIMSITGHLTPTMLGRYTHLRGDRLGERLPGGRLNAKPG